MTDFQKVIKYLAIALAVFIVASIFSGIIGTAASIIGLFTDGFSEDNGEYTLRELSEDTVTSIDVDVSATSLSICVGDKLTVSTTSDRIKASINGGILKIKEKSSLFTSSSAKAVITLPSDQLNKISISAGAGDLEIKGICAKIIELDLGAGDTKLDSLTVSKKLDINGGAGKLDVLSSDIQGLDFDMGVGEVNVSASIQGNADIDCGIGDLDLELIGAEDDYSIDIDKGVGSVSVDGKSVSDSEVIGNGDSKIKLSCGIGAVKISFKALIETEA